MNPDQEAFLARIKEKPDDEALRQVYADWLDEHDQPDEANRQREAVGAIQWLRAFMLRINYYDYDEETYERIPGTAKEGQPHTFQDILDIGQEGLNGEGCFGTDAGADVFREGEVSKEEFFRNWSLVTGVPVTETQAEDVYFRCAC